MKFTELTDKQWSMVEQHLPEPARIGRPRCNDRKTINGIIFVLVTGCRWDEMPERTVPNQLLICDCRDGSKKESGKIFCHVQSNLPTKQAR